MKEFATHCRGKDLIDRIDFTRVMVLYEENCVILVENVEDLWQCTQSVEYWLRSRPSFLIDGTQPDVKVLHDLPSDMHSEVDRWLMEMGFEK